MFLLIFERKGNTDTVVDANVDIDKCSGRLHQQLWQLSLGRGLRGLNTLLYFFSQKRLIAFKIIVKEKEKLGEESFLHSQKSNKMTLKQKKTLNKIFTQNREFLLNDFSGCSTLNKKICFVSVFVKNIHKISELILLSR